MPKKTVRVLNPEKAKNKGIKKRSATDRQSNARKKIKDARKRIADKEARKAKLEELVKQAKGKDKVALNQELIKVNKELVQEDKVMQNAIAEEEEHKQQEAATNNEDKYSDMEVDNHENPKTTTKGNVALIKALLAGTALSDPLVPLDISIRARLGKHESVISYKNSLGKVGIICNTKIKG